MLSAIELAHKKNSRLKESSVPFPYPRFFRLTFYNERGGNWSRRTKNSCF